MTLARHVSIIAIAVAGALGACAAAGQGDIRSYEGMCDASAVVSLDADTFVVANDEDNVLRIYRVGQPKPLGEGLDLSAFLDAAAGEVDIEGAAQLGSRIYWITSHGANKNGKPRPERRRFFATDIVTDAGGVKLVPAGKPYRDLVADLTKWDDRNRFDFPVRAQRPPEADGLNIEGLVARPDGTLLLAFRSPVANGAFKLFLWDGREKTGRALPIDLGAMSPEAIAIRHGTADRLLLFSDDGDLQVDGAPCKEAPAARRSFRGSEVAVPTR